MKPLKKAKQKNIIINAYYYTSSQLKTLEQKPGIFCEGTHLRIFTDEIKTIKVVLDDYGYYTNVVVTKDDDIIYVEL